MNDDDWMADAICRGHYALFFAPPSERPANKLVREAKAQEMCSQCPVRNPCRSAGQVNPEGGQEYGIWGGELMYAP